MTDVQKKQIRACLADWAEQAIAEDFFPVIMFCLKGKDEAMICRSHDHSVNAIRELLKQAVKSI